MKTEEVIAALPHDIMHEILSRLPMKNLFKFKCVSKTWFNLISDLYFLQLQRDRSKQNLRFLCTSEKNGHPLWTGKFTSMDRGGNVLNAFTIAKDHVESLRLLPTRCDLVCFAIRRHGIECIYLCNPSTQQLLALPESPYSKRFISFGFGFLPSTNEYKVVHLYYNGCGNFEDMNCEVFTLGGGGSGIGSFRTSWRTVKDRCPCHAERTRDPAFVNGTIFWMKAYTIKFPWDTKDDFILSFNTETEKFRTISYPADCQRKQSGRHIMELRGMLCLVDTISTRTTSTMVIWTLEDYNGCCIWVKGYSIDMAAIHSSIWGCVPIYMSDGEIIMGSTGTESIHLHHYIYNIENKSFRREPLEGVFGEVVIYWESCFSL